MSTIKSSDEHLTLNADGSSKDIKFQANGVEKASISSSGAFTSTTIDATKLTGALPAISGAALTGVGVSGITSAADATAIKIDSSERVAIGNTDAGNYNGTADNLVVYDASNHAGITIANGGANKVGAIYFADGTSGTAEYEGYIEYNHNNDNLNFGTNHASRMLISSNGHVTMPNQPSFHVNDSPSKDAGGKLYNFGSVVHNIGSHYVNSTGRFTAPVAGRYLFTAGIFATQNTDTFVSVAVNGGGNWGGAHVYNNSGETSSGTLSVIANLAASDYVQLDCGYAVQGSAPRNFFSGMLIG